MTVEELIAKYNGKPCKILPNTLPPQCFDLAVAYTDSLGIPHYPNNPSPFPYVNASQIYTNFGSFQEQYFIKIPNTADAVPQKGDLVVWASSYNNGAGHVAIATGSGDTNHFQAFQQNDPNPYCQLKDYSYSSVLGWLRDKISPVQVDDCPAKLKTITEERDRLNGIIAGKDNEIKTCSASLSSITAEKNSLSVQLTEVLKQSEIYKAEYDKTNAPDGYKVQITHLEDKVKLQAEEITKQTKLVSYWQTKYNNAKKPIQKLIIAMAEKLGVQI
jgi:hypothetical protein